MKTIDIKSVIIGILGTVLIFVLMGVNTQDKNLGDITVNSIKVLDDGDGGYVSTYNKEGLQTTFLGTDKNGSGTFGMNNKKGYASFYVGDYVSIYNTSGKKIIYFGMNSEDGGLIETYNENQEKCVYMGSNKNNDGMIGLFDRYGDLGWVETGKQ